MYLSYEKTSKWFINCFNMKMCVKRPINDIKYSGKPETKITFARLKK